MTKCCVTRGITYLRVRASVKSNDAVHITPQEWVVRYVQLRCLRVSKRTPVTVVQLYLLRPEVGSIIRYYSGAVICQVTMKLRVSCSVMFGGLSYLS